MYDALGREVVTTALDIEAAGPRTLRLDVSVLPPGVYVVRAASEASVASARFTVVR